MGADGIIEGAAALELALPGAPAALLLHGGGDTPQAMSGLAEYLHGRGYAVRAPLLASHGRSLSALVNASAETWRAEVRRAYDELAAKHPWVAVVGLSMGGAMGVSLAAERVGQVPALVLLAPYLDMPPAIRRLARTTHLWGWALPYFSSLGRRSVRDPVAAARGLGHGILTPQALRAFHETMTAAVAALPAVQAPTLVVQSREDNRIPVSGAERAFALLGAADKEIVWTEGAGHVITVDYGHERVFALVSDWLDRHRATTAAGGPAQPGSHQSP
jgi:carboxylesterase